MNNKVAQFAAHYLKELREDNSAVFIGAGLSVPANVVDWAGLIEPLANELGLDVKREHDLISIAQFYYNYKGQNRHRITQRLVDEFAKNIGGTENHTLLAKLPLQTYWTTNFDNLIEKALLNYGRIPDVKYTIQQLATTKSKRDAIVYKMHGDISHAEKIVLIKDDYENYSRTHAPFLNALAGHLVSNTFLFVGFSFTDPNLDHIFSHVRTMFSKDQREHFAIFKKRRPLPGEANADSEYAIKRQNYLIEDLKRFNVQVVLVDEYTEITEMLRWLECGIRTGTVFTSGSAYEYGSWSPEAAHQLARIIGTELVRSGKRVVSGFGSNIGPHLMSGATEYALGHHIPLDDAVLIRPFPRYLSNSSERSKLWTAYREEMIIRSGAAIFMFGNKVENGGTVLANGVMEEFELCLKHGVKPIPIGSTGYMAQKIHERVMDNLDEIFGSIAIKIKDDLKALATEVDKSIITRRVVQIINSLEVN